MRSAQLLVAFLLALVTGAATQERRHSEGGFDLALHALWSHQLLEDSPDQSAPGVAVGLGYRLPIGLGVELRSSYRSWEQDTYVPLHLGLRYDLSLSSLVTLAPFAGMGPSLVWGGDWGSVFASFDLGARAYVSLGQDARVRLSLEAAYGRGMAFHPDAFGVVTVGGGLSLLL